MDEETIMARLVKRFRDQPYVVSVGSETRTICGCGLSATQPFCDGTHELIQAEEPALLYWYDDGGYHYAASDSYPGIRSEKMTQDAQPQVDMADFSSRQPRGA